MINPIRRIKQGLEDFATDHPFAMAAAALYVTATAALNGLFYSTQASVEGVERAFGTTPYRTTATLKEKGVARGPHSRIAYGVFVDSQGKELRLMDSPVVTEGKLLPGTLEKMKPESTYDISVFGSPKWVQRIVDAKPISQ